MHKQHFLPNKDYVGLNDDCLQPGDIVLTRGDNRLSKVIQKLTKNNFSHALLILDRNIFIEATSEGVSIKNTNRIIVNSVDDICVLRYPYLTKEQFNIINIFCRNGAFSCKYNLKGILLKEKSSFIKDKFYCSELVYVAYHYAGIKLCYKGNKFKNLITPGDLYESWVLTRIGGCCIPLSSQYIQNLPSEFFHDYQLTTVKIFMTKVNKMLRKYNIKLERLYDILQIPNLIGTKIDPELFYTHIDKELCDIFDETRYGYMNEDYVLNKAEASKGSLYIAFNIPIEKIQEMTKSYAYNFLRFKNEYTELHNMNIKIKSKFYDKLIEMYKRNFKNCFKYYEVCREAEHIFYYLSLSVPNSRHI